jgi:hypothetical protein
MLSSEPMNPSKCSQIWMPKLPKILIGLAKVSCFLQVYTERQAFEQLTYPHKRRKAGHLLDNLVGRSAADMAGFLPITSLFAGLHILVGLRYIFRIVLPMCFTMFLRVSHLDP